MIDPFDVRLLKPCSYVLRLGAECMVWRAGGQPISIADYEPSPEDFDRLHTDDVCLQNGALVLCGTMERIAVPEHLFGVLSTTSHLARFGISVHQGSMYVSPGYGHLNPSGLTLEMTCCNPNAVRLRRGLPACHIAFFEVNGPGTPNATLATSVYEGKQAPSPPLFAREMASILDTIGQSARDRREHAQGAENAQSRYQKLNR